MELRSAVKKLYSGMFSYSGGWRSTISSFCDVQSYYFSKTSKETKEQARYFFRNFEKLSNSPVLPLLIPDAVVKFATAKVCPAVVCLSTEKETRGSGIIVDSKGTILTCASNVFRLGVRGQVNVSLLNGRNLSGTVLNIDKKHHFALLKIQSNIPLPIPRFGSLQDTKGSHLIFLQHKFGRLANRSPSSQKELDEEENLMRSNNKFEYEDCYVGGSGGPIFNLHGEVVGITIDVMNYNVGVYGVIDAVAIEEAFCSVGYLQKGNRFSNGKTLSCLKAMRCRGGSFGMLNKNGFTFCR